MSSNNEKRIEDKEKIIHDYGSILYMDKSYLDDAEMVLLAIKNTKVSRWIEEDSEHYEIKHRTPMIYEHISDRLKRSKSIIEASIIFDPESIKYVDVDLLKDDDFFKRLLTLNVDIIGYTIINKNYEKDLEFVKSLILKSCVDKKEIYSSLARLVKKDKEFVLQLVEIDPVSAIKISPDDPDVILKAINNTRTRRFEEDECEIQRNEERFIPLEYASDSLRQNSTVLEASVAKDPKSICYISQYVKIHRYEYKDLLEKLENINPNINYWKEYWNE